MPFELTILGSSSATPIHNRHPTAQVLNVRERFFLIDCGEGTQSQLIRYRIRHSRIGHIFISHLHGDHYFGLLGLMSTMHLQGRTNELHLYGPPELMDIIELQLRMSQTVLRYNLIFHAVRSYTSAIIHEDNDLIVQSVVLNHRIPCTGFIFREKQKPRKLLSEKIKQYQIPYSYFNAIKAGADYEDNSGNVIPNEELTLPSGKARSYAFCSDTMYTESLSEDIQGVDLLYHESTFMHEMFERARATYHSTSHEAALLARKGNVGRLLIGHFSSRYKDLNPMLEEARAVFPDTELATEGSRFQVSEQI